MATATQLRADIPTPPRRMRDLPIDERGYPVPWFVQWIKGKPEFRIMDADKFVRALREKRCWICGGPRGREMVFTIGPMCAVNRINAEPPSHIDCARYAAMACPFLTKPQMVRRENDLPAERTMHESSIDRNPGVACLWFCSTFSLVPIATGTLFRLGTPSKTEWYCRGRVATRDEVMQSMSTGLPLLERECERENDPDAARQRLNYAWAKAMRLLPA